LERKGLVERSGHAGDRRVWLLSSTARAAPIVEEIIALDAALRQEMWTGISQAERRTLHQILGRLQTNLAAVLHEQT
jgi:DNA-binding MarR family transcriptional regulator